MDSSMTVFTVGRLTQQLNTYDENLSLEALLEEEEFAAILQGIYRSFPKKSKTTAQRIFRATNGVKPKKSRSAALAAVLDIRTIALPPHIQFQFQLWKEDPSQFWKTYGAQLGARWDSDKASIESIAAMAYVVVRQLGLRRLLDTILWRFYTTLLYNMFLLLGDGQLNMTRALDQRLIKAVSQFDNIVDDDTTIKQNLRSWTGAGRRYHQICLRLDRGALFLLPQISDKVWEDENSSLKGLEFDLAMTHLKRRGILSLSAQLGAEKLSNQILDSVLNSFRWHVTVSMPARGASVANARETTSDNNPASSHSNSHSIKSLLNAAENIEEALQSHTVPPIENPLITVAIEENNAPGREITTNGQSKIGNTRDSRGVELQTEMHDRQQKRKRADSLPNDVARSTTDHERDVHGAITEALSSTQSSTLTLSSSFAEPIGGDFSDFENSMHDSTRIPSTGLTNRDTSSHSSRFQHSTEHQGPGNPTRLLDSLESSPVAPAQDLIRDRGTCHQNALGQLSRGIILTPWDSTLLSPETTNENSSAASVLSIERLRCLVLGQPDCIQGNIWFGNIDSFRSFIFFKISKSLANIELHGELNGPVEKSLDVGAFLIRRQDFLDAIRHEGFGDVYWTKCRTNHEEAFITLYVKDKSLDEVFRRCGQFYEFDSPDGG